jgi:pyrroloquinoline quinone (PQQ) biosynthesis protein C
MMKTLTNILEIELARTMEHIKNCDWKNKNFYADYMAQTFYYVRHSTRLLALSASRLNYEEEQGYHLRFIAHLKEESNHEKLAINDLKHLGFELEDMPELSSTRLFYEPQYYKVEHERPLALMGYILYLEALAQKACPPLVAELSVKYGNRCATFFHVHGEEDPEHVAAALNLISSLSEKDLDCIRRNIVQSAHAYNGLLSDLQAKWKINNIVKAA